MDPVTLNLFLTDLKAGKSNVKVDLMSGEGPLLGSYTVISTLCLVVRDQSERVPEVTSTKH